MENLIKFKEALNICANTIDKVIEIKKRAEAGEKIAEKEVEEANDATILAFVKLQILSQLLD